jgi:hypothetical protein
MSDSNLNIPDTKKENIFCKYKIPLWLAIIFIIFLLYILGVWWGLFCEFDFSTFSCKPKTEYAFNDSAILGMQSITPAERLLPTTG